MLVNSEGLYESPEEVVATGQGQGAMGSEALVRGLARSPHQNSSHLCFYPKSLQFSFGRFNQPTFDLDVCGSPKRATAPGVEHCSLQGIRQLGGDLVCSVLPLAGGAARLQSPGSGEGWPREM